MRKVNGIMKTRRFRFLLIPVILLVITGSPFIARLWVHILASGRIHSEIRDIPEAPVALVLGAGVRSDGEPSLLLRDRLNSAIQLYEAGKVQKLLMSGDNRFHYYNEPAAMKRYAVKQGVPPEDIVEDFAGRRTYDSIYRAKHIFGQDRLIIVTQGFHLDRAVYLSRKLGVEAVGYPAPIAVNMKSRMREVWACLYAIRDGELRPLPPILGSPEPIDAE